MAVWQLTQDRVDVKVYALQHTDALDQRLRATTFAGSVHNYGRKEHGSFHEGRKVSLSVHYLFPENEPWKYELRYTFPLLDDRFPLVSTHVILPSGIQRIWQGPRETDSGILHRTERADLIIVGTLLLTELPSPLDPRFFGDPKQYRPKLP